MLDEVFLQHGRNRPNVDGLDDLVLKQDPSEDQQAELVRGTAPLQAIDTVDHLLVELRRLIIREGGEVALSQV